MKRALLVLVAAAAGLLASEVLYRWNLLRTSDKPVAGEIAPTPEVAHELDLLRFQFPDEQSFAEALSASAFSHGDLRAEVAEHLRQRQSIQQQIAPQLDVSAEEVRQFYNANPELFAQPQRFRASHIFVAAPDGSPSEVLAMKQSEIQAAAVRLLSGEIFSALAAELSEDEATKTRGGDLGCFSAWRMPREFMAEVEKLSPGEMSGPIRSHLGFHIVRLTGVKPPRQMRFEEVEAEIRSALANAKRAAAVARIAAQTSAH